MGEHQLRLRELTDDWTPGRVLHLTGKAVKALGVPDGGHVVVQFLEYSPPLQPCDSVFWVLRRYVADGVAGVAWSVPLEWPPDELVVNGRPELGAPNFDDLRETVAVVRVTVDRPAAACPPHSPGHGRPQYLRTRPASVVIARLHPKKATWETIRPGKRRQVRAARAAGVTPDQPYTEPRFHSATHPFVARPTGSGTVRYSRFLQSLATGRGRCVLVLQASQGTTPPQARRDRTLGTVHKRRGGVHTLRRGGGQRRGAWRSTTAGARGTAAPKLASAWATLTLGTARARMRGTGGMACRNAHHATHWGEARVLTDTPTRRR